METVRLRLKFDDIVNESQKNGEELKHCWILLKPEHQTISDLASYLLRIFDLQNACPSGLLLSMEGFVLPPFESTLILKDKDIVRVEKRGLTSSAAVRIANDLNSLDVVEIVDRPPVTAGMQLLANEEFEKESGGYESESEELVPGQAEVALQEEEPAEVRTVSKKRKRKDLKEKQRSKRKKSQCRSAEKCVDVLENGGNNVCGEHDKTLSASKADQRSDKSGKASTSANGSCHPSENGKENVDGLDIPIAKKLSSRSARRKQVKRQRLKEQATAEKKQQHQRQLLEKTNQQSSEEDNHQVAEQSNDNLGQIICEGPEKVNDKPKVDQEQPDQRSDTDDDVIPVMIRPGHIRYESRNKVTADQTVQQNQISVETFQWNGVTSKKRGQKWGTEKPVPHKRNDYWNNSNNLNQECPRMPSIEETPIYDHIEFDKLSPYVSMPKEGDIIAYRLIELSSSWTPEVSSYRVGKISRYDTHSSRITLMPVPEYPVIPQKKVDDEESTMLPETSLCAEDGSLEIDFISLLEVRTIKLSDLNSAKPIVNGANKIHVRDEDARKDFSHPSNESHASARANGEVNPWEEINKALDAKKAQLSQEDNWNRAESSGRRPWSYKALRGSALGPTMALLREQNGL